MKVNRPILRDISTISFIFALTGILVGIAEGLTVAIQNLYITHRMMEILFGTIAGSINHHLGIFLVIAAGNILLLVVLKFFRISSIMSTIFGFLPLTLLGIFYFYILPTTGFQLAIIKRFTGKVVIQNYIYILFFLAFSILLWLFGLRKQFQLLRKKKLTKALSRSTIFLTISIFLLIVNILDLINWSNVTRPKWNLILISIDTLRADHLGCYGYEKNISQNIDSFAIEGVQFMKAISQSSWTLPSHASLFTGVYPSVHGAVSKKRSIPLSFLTPAEILYNAGYYTAAFTGGAFLDPEFGFKQGFIEYRQFEAMDSEEIWNFIDDKGNEPFFLFIHTYKVHNYYVPNELLKNIDKDYFEDYIDWNWESIRSFLITYSFEDLNNESWRAVEYLQERYDLSISFIDEQFGSLIAGIKERGLFKNTLIILLSDHGEEFGDHGRVHHGCTLYNEQIHIPLIMSLPSNAGSQRVINEVVELIDIYPTILDYLDLPIPTGIDGQSLVHLIDGGGTTDGLAFSEISYNVSEKYSVSDSVTKLIYSPRTENTAIPGNDELNTFDITWGPGWKETASSIEGNKLVVPFQEWYERMMHKKVTSSEREETDLDLMLKQRLEALGYIQ